ncbi:CD9 antigen-like, partial [Plectropomus leopardus]|uniref:CD9 antigen-like n=1 Tax=Plectropomus leopardus TaxID=160734 RepID=UPI001C4A9D0F
VGLYFLSVVLQVVGFVFLGLGLWLRFSDSTRPIFEVEALNSSAFVMIVTILIALGSVMLIVVVFGDYGACNEKRCSLQVVRRLHTLTSCCVIAAACLT